SLLDAPERLTLRAAGAAQRSLEHAVAERVERPEAEILELDLEAVDAEPVRDRRVDLERLARDPPLLLARQGRDRAHVVRPVRELHEHDAQILHHREDHLAEALGLRLRGAVEAELVQLADAVDQVSDVVAETLPNLFERRRRILEHVVEQGGLDRAGVEIQARDDLRDADRMRDIRLAAAAVLTFVSLRGEFVRLDDALQVPLGKVGGEALEQLPETVIVSAPDDGQPSFANRAADHSPPPRSEAPLTLRRRAAASAAGDRPGSIPDSSRDSGGRRPADRAPRGFARRYSPRRSHATPRRSACRSPTRPSPERRSRAD